jgi:hypothetical protein
LRYQNKSGIKSAEPGITGISDNGQTPDQKQQETHLPASSKSKKIRQLMAVMLPGQLVFCEADWAPSAEKRSGPFA